METPRHNRHQRGFSLVELMIVMVITLIILASVFSLMRASITTANANYEMTTATQGLRNAEEFITRDILLGANGMKGVATIWLPTRFVTTFLTRRPASEIDPSNTGYTNIGTIIADNNIPAGTTIPNSATSTTFLPLSDRLSMVAADSSFSSIPLNAGDVNVNNGSIQVPASRVADFSVGEIYFISNGVSATFGTVTDVNTGSNSIKWGGSDVYGLNRTGSTGSLNSVAGADLPMTLMRTMIVQYFSDAEGRLVRRVFGVKGQGFIDSIVAEHLVTLQFRYVFKPDSANVILGQPSDTVDFNESANVFTIELNLSVRTAYPLQDGEFHQVEGSTRAGVRNIQYLEAAMPRDSQGNTDLPNPGPPPRVTPTPPPTPVPTPTPVPDGSPTATPTPVPTASPTPTVSPSPTATP